MKYLLILTVAFFATVVSADFRQDNEWSDSKKEVGNHGWLKIKVISSKVKTTDILEKVVAVRILFKDGTWGRGVLESGLPNGMNLLKEIAIDYKMGYRSEERFRVVCVGTFYGNKTKKRYLVFRVKEYEEK